MRFNLEHGYECIITMSVFNPLVSICIPCFNGGRYIKEAIQSAIDQTYRPLEIVISDDSSTDGSMEIIRSMQSNSLIPFYIVNHTPSIIGANWNNCVRLAKGKYIKFLFQDDLIYPNCISEMVALSETDDRIGLTFCNREIIGDLNDKAEWLHRYGNLSVEWNGLNTIQDGNILFKQRNFFNPPMNKIGEPTVVMLRKQCFEDIGFFSEELKQTLDYQYWYRMLPKYKIGFINEKLAAFRLHDNQATQQNLTGLESEYLIYYKSIYKTVIRYLSWYNRVKITFKIFKLTLRDMYLAIIQKHK